MDKKVEEIRNQLTQEGFNINGEGANFVVNDNIEICILSRKEEYVIELPKQKTESKFYYFILHSAGLGTIWLLREDELIKVRDIGLDERDTSGYIVKHFDRLNKPALSLEEYKG